SVFGTALTDSLKASHLSDTEKLRLQQNVAKTVKAMNTYIDDLKVMLADKNFEFRSFRIGKELYADKFKYDLATNFTPEQIYEKALADKKVYQQKMADLAGNVWQKYYGNQPKLGNSMQMIQLVMDKIQLQHAAPKDFYDS